MMDIKGKKQFIITFIFYIIIFLFSGIFLKYGLPVVLPFAVGFIISMLLKPIWLFISEKTKTKVKFAAFITVLIFYALIALIIFFLGKRLITEAVSLAGSLPQIIREIIIPYINSIAQKLTDLLQNVLNTDSGSGYFTNSISVLSDKLASFTADFLTDLIKSIPSLIIGCVFTVISTFYFSSDYYKITSSVSKLFPKRHRNKLFKFKEIFESNILNMIKGYIIIMFITFIEVFIGLSLLRTKNALVLSVMIAVLDMLPIIGSGTFLIPISIFGFLNDRFSYSIGILILYAIITVIREIIEPKIIGKRIGLPTIVMLITAYIGLKLFGFSGIIVLPLVVTVIKEYIKESTVTISDERS